MEQYDLAARGENDGLWDWNLTTNRIRFSRRWISMLGCEEHEVGDNPEEWFRRIHPEDATQVRLAIDAHLAGSIPEIDNQHRMRHVDGTYRWMHCRGTVMLNEKGRAVRLAGSHADITAEKVTDALTGLPNRFLLLDRLGRSIERANRHNDFLFALLLINLDRFSPLIERLGSNAGDQLLIAAARRLETCLRTWNTESQTGADYVVARLGGDEFAVLLEGLTEIGEAKIAAERLLKEIATPFELGGRELFLSASMGVALSLTGYSRSEGILRDADTAMRRAKSLGKARCEVFDTAVLDSAQRQAQLETELREGFERQEFQVYFQPIVSLASNHIAGFETLVRWNHPARGVISPQEFVPAAERTGLIVPLGQWVLREACRQLKTWQQLEGIPRELWVSVNFSSLQFRQPSLSERIGEVLSDIELDPHCLMLELTESVAMENPEAVSSVLMQLRVMGVQLGLDDFGTGYSSLGYLPRFPVDYLKIEHSFVRRMETSKDMVGIVRAINELAHQLGLHVVVEGIERVEQLHLARSLGCEYGQGFLFSRAVDGERATELLKVDLPQFKGTGSGAEASDGNPTLPDRFSPESPQPAVVEPDPACPENRVEDGSLARKKGPLIVAIAALLLLLAGGLVVRFKDATPPPSAGVPAPSNPTAGEATGLPAVSGSTVDMLANQGSQKPLLHEVNAERTPVVPQPPRKKPVTSTFPVIHDHFWGNGCKGILKISQDTFSFVSEKEKDSFSLKYDEFTPLLSDDCLIIKSGTKTYRFKAAAAGGKDENRSQLQSIIQSIYKVHPEKASGK